MTSPSRHLSSIQYKGVLKLGDIMVPGSEDFPSFSAYGCAEHIDDILDHMGQGDRNDLSMLMGIFSFLPSACIRLILFMLEKTSRLPGDLGAFQRFLLMGLKGLIMTLYYSGKKGTDYTGPHTHTLLGYSVAVSQNSGRDPDRSGSD